ncbi:MAG: carboxypeptidase-like regulatory domain-containing protein [Bdellovibrionales bacterium]
MFAKNDSIFNHLNPILVLYGGSSPADKSLMKVWSRFPSSAMAVFSILALFLTGCGGGSGSNGGSSTGSCAVGQRVSTDVTGPTIASYCSGSTAYSGGITVTGSATYQARTHDTAAVTSTKGLTGVSAARPIRYAEVVVVDASNNQVQCTETDATGAFSFTLPADNKTYGVRVRSRADNSYVKANIMDCPEENGTYELTANILADASKDIGTLNAGVTGEILGGAFNIFDQILEANEYLRTQVGSCAFTGCQAFTVAPMANVYWTPGFNPASYSGSSSVGSSFFVPSSNRVFILGGINGDTDTSDTDHFDNSVIIHEYGHFLETNVLASDSPGGSHSADRLIDPRLAWSDCWGNFFQGAVLGIGAYIDTYGNSDGTTGDYFRVDLENQSGIYKDKPVNAEEGNFREFSVSRVLWDSIDTDNDGETISGGFPELWASLTNTASGGFLGASSAFRSIGLVHAFQDTLSGGTDWSTIRTLAKQTADRSNYATYMDNTGVCAPGTISITPSSLSNLDSLSADDGSTTSSHLLLNNDFYHYKHDGGVLTVKLSYSATSTSEADLDLYVYSSDGTTTAGRLFNENDMIHPVDEGQKTPDGILGTGEEETVSATVPAGDYLIHVNVWTGNSMGLPDGNNEYPAYATDYTLQVGGLCYVQQHYRRKQQKRDTPKSRLSPYDCSDVNGWNWYHCEHSTALGGNSIYPLYTSESEI